MGVAKLLNQAKNEAGIHAVAAAQAGRYGERRAWEMLAIEIAHLEQQAIAASVIR